MKNFHRLEEIPDHDMDGIKLKVLSGKQSMVFWGEMSAGSHAPRHQHPNEQITWLRSGRMEYRIEDGEVQSVEAGGVMLIPGGVDHEAWYREDCEIVEFFSPPRFDLFPAATEHPYASTGQ